MTVLRGLFLTVSLGALAVIGGILSNWIPRPANMKTRWTVIGLAGVVLVAAIVALVADGRSRPLGEWVADVNKSCAPFTARIAEATEHRGAIDQSRPIREHLPPLKELEAAHSDQYREVSGIRLPSDLNDRAAAESWLNAYGVRRDRLVNFVDQIEGVPDSLTFADVLTAIQIGQSAQAFAEATTEETRKSETLGISCR
ncbi:hypothetical protein [Actinoplanes regularis]|uniref:hypothetical protein n=1 Tax=Actinoplanes regularis TaxID=52697 RepID=UPI0024A3A1F8|nr:hypothetical protein [Actinoplanes regularis]GLW30581.1 hypothetical protein Areg01_35210 [Actinoplanes regularis]